MARIFITGSSDGLGLNAAELLLQQGHQVTRRAGSERRARDARQRLTAAEGVVVGDVSTLAAMRSVAEQANACGRFDAVIHNVAIGYREPVRVETADGIERLFAINVLAPYVLTALITPPQRLVYLSSGMHRGGDSDLRDPQWQKRRWNGSQAYATSELLDTVLAFGVARRWPKVLSNALEPGWVATKMGDAGARDDLSQGHVTQAWLAVSDDAAAKVSGGYFYHQAPRVLNPAARDETLQDALLVYCEQLSGVRLPRRAGAIACSRA
jgi:NAD(P)-dependent dehydrogenase (short-subunit alcohol dehydrogenase family)